MEADTCGSIPKKKKFHLNTESTCFLCSGEILRNMGHDINKHAIKIEEGVIPSSQVSLHGICRYLRINFKQILKEEGCEELDAVKLLMEEKMSEVLVTLCTQCSNVIVPLSNLCMELELLEMKMEHHLKSVGGVLENLKSDQSSTNHIGNSTTNQMTVNHHQDIARLLRMEMKKKCNSKLDQIVPKVQLSKDISVPKGENSTEHQNTRSGCQKFKCKVCGKAYQYRAGLWTHTKVEHEKSMSRRQMSKCEVCGNVYQHPESLLRHRKKVHRLKPKKLKPGPKRRVNKEPVAESLFADITPRVHAVNISNEETFFDTSTIESDYSVDEARTEEQENNVCTEEQYPNPTVVAGNEFDIHSNDLSEELMIFPN